jgi:hypothetical protein
VYLFDSHNGLSVKYLLHQLLVFNGSANSVFHVKFFLTIDVFLLAFKILREHMSF